MPVLALIYATVFIVGPALFLWLSRPRPSRKQFVGIGCIVAGATALSFALRYMLGGWGQDTLITLSGIGLIWLAWIGILVFVAQTFRKQDPSRRMRKWTAVIGALATTIPWFGLASARMMTF